MRFFICDLDEIRLGIPADKTKRVISAPRTQDVPCETAGGELFISIPVLLQRKAVPAPHAIVLKNAGGETGHRTLLLPRIDVDLDIPEEKIHSLPKAMTAAMSFFSGVCFTGKNLILLLDTEKLVEYAVS